MRLLGLDYGASRIGVALSDEGGVLAFPYAVYSNDKELMEKLIVLHKEYSFEGVVLGESRDFQDKENNIMAKIRRFAQTLEEKIQIPVFFEPEFLTTVEAKRLGKGDMLDAHAAAIILQSYLDKKQNV